LKAPPKEQPRTLENTREVDETMIQDDDEEVTIGWIEFVQFADITR
jgi:hypothetical protein